MEEQKIITYDNLDKEYELQLEKSNSELEKLNIERANIGNPKKLVDSIAQIVWQQFILQIAGQAGKDFIKENNDLNLSLKKADHILNSASFVKGEFPSHNQENLDKYQSRYEEWLSNFKDNDPNNKIIRDAFDKNRPTGSGSMSMDHTIPVSEILRDPDAATYLSQEEKIKFANDTNINLQELDREANSSKGDQSMEDWLNSTRDGKHPDERFNIDKEELLERDEKAREEYAKLKEEGKEQAIKEGKESIKNEASRSLNYAAQAIAVALFAKLTREIFGAIFVWLSSKNRSTKSLLNEIVKAIKHFIFDFKNNILLSLDVGATVILTQLLGEIVPMIRKALLLVVEGGKCFIEVKKYLSSEENKNKEQAVQTLEIGEIVTLRVTTVGGIALGQVITGVLSYYVPPLAVQIPLLGSPASLLGIFFGGLTSGICGAITLNLIEQCLKKQMISNNTSKIINVNNEKNNILNKQNELIENELDNVKRNAIETINNRHIQAIDKINNQEQEKQSNNKDKLDELDDLLKSM